MLTLLSDFVEELRAAGIPVSMVEGIDAMKAVEHIDLGDRRALKETLRATLVKNSRHEPAFDVAFEVFFAIRRRDRDGSDERPLETSARPHDDSSQSGSGGSEMDLQELMDALLAAMQRQDFPALRQHARQAVEDLAGMEPGRPVGGTYYLYRTLRQLDVDALTERLMAALLRDVDPDDDLARRLVAEEVGERIERLRQEVQEEIRRRLVDDRGHEAVAKTLRSPLVEDVDLMHATRTDLKNIEHIIEPLTRKLAARLTQRRRRSRDGRLDFRKTMRASLATGGVPIEPKFKHPHPHKPEIFLLCDISGSMATFARFTLQFTYAMGTQFSRLRAFVFVDAVDEVTELLVPGVDFKDALARIGTEADVVWLDGHSDYGHAFEQFAGSYGREITAKTTLIVAGDGRNNYREPRAQHFAEVARSARDVYWLNPEPKAYWDTGDSVMSRYAAHCDEVFEVRNLRQLEAFVERLTLHPTIRGSSQKRSTRASGRPMVSIDR